jgi:hypothetical protein
LLENAIDIFAVPNPYDVYGEQVIFNGVHDAVLASTQAVAILSRELLASDGARFFCKPLDLLHNTLTVPLARYRLDLFDGRWFD